ncbi:MAG TPA: hypothetical protein PLJ38_04385, partial [bacterium]|nr:hypothetical protein [bacterium]
KAVNTAYAGNSAYYNNVSINNITFTDSTVARLFLNNQLKPSSDTIGISKYIRDFSDSNILNDTVSVTPIDTTRPYLTRIQVINNDANTDITSGDTLALYFSESINTATVNVNNVKTILGVNLGDTTAIDIYWGYYNTIMYVKIGTNPSIIYPSYINPQDTVVFTDYSDNQDSTLSELLIPDNYPPDAPTNVIMQDTDLPYANAGYDNDNAINIWWTAPIATDVDSYAVYISTNNGQYALVDYTANTYYNYTNLNYHYSYKAVVRAIDRAGNYSDTSNATASIISDTYATRPNAPQPTDANYNINFDTDNIINWQWTTSDTDIDYYMVYVDSGYGFVYYDTTNVNEIQLTGTYRNTYRLRVQAVDFAGNISDTSLASIYVTVDTGDVCSPNNIIHTDNANPGYEMIPLCILLGLLRPIQISVFLVCGINLIIIHLYISGQRQIIIIH